MDSAFAYLHFAAILALTALLAAQFFLCNEHLQPGHVRLLARIDLGYVATAIVVLATGLIRLIWYAKGPAFYLDNPFFYLKIALFLSIGLISIAPTLQFLRWNRALDDGRVRVLSGADIARVRGFVGLELLLLVLIPLTAVLMARGVSPLS